MASSSLTPCLTHVQQPQRDLINLEEEAVEDVGAAAGGNNVTDDGSPEELEHLLDVCPPQLEEKLLLTRKGAGEGRAEAQQQEKVEEEEERKAERRVEGSIRGEATGSNEREKAREDDDEDILVKLGHDKLVPRRKRIDVVSSETIKRIRDITKNLEPVIRNCTDIAVAASSSGDHHPVAESLADFAVYDSAYETERAINIAFNFLSQIDDERVEKEVEEEQENDDRHRSPASKRRKNSSFICHPLEPTCLVRINSNNFSSDSSFRTRNARLDRRNKDNDNDYSSSSSSSVVDIDEIFKASASNISSSRVSSKKKQSGRMKEAVVGQDSPASCSSECSEVDWSWVAEYDTRPCGNSPKFETADDTRSIILDGIMAANERSEESKREAARVSVAAAENNDDDDDDDNSVAMSVADAVSLVVAPPPAPPPPSSSASPPSCLFDSTLNFGARKEANDATTTILSTSGDSSNFVYFSNDECDATSTDNFHLENDETILVSSENPRNRIGGCQGGGGGNNADRCTSSPRISWLRASMRRLRHLRLPDATANGNTAAVRQTNIPRNQSLLPLQHGPNSLPDISLVAPEVLAAHTNSTTGGGGGRPSSAPVYNQRSSSNLNQSVSSSPGRGQRRATNGHSPSAPPPPPPLPPPPPPRNSSNNNNNVRTRACSGSNERAASTNAGSSGPARRICERARESAERRRSSGGGEDEREEEIGGLGRWPHPLSAALACLGCTLGLFNMSRFATLSIQFGANFIVQFLVLSLVLGIPLLTLQVCLGQRLGAGAVDMWRISPIFQGVGIALLVAQASIGIYSIIGVSWMLVYFRDSFITKQERYRWAEPFGLYRDHARTLDNSSGNYKLEETVPDYFSGVVLERHALNEEEPEAGGGGAGVVGGDGGGGAVVTLKFQVAFNLAVVWMIVFVSLSKGLRSYGKVVYVLTLVPVLGTLVLCTKLLGLTPPGSINQLFPATVWSEFFINGKSWVAASSEVFLTWGVFGAAAMQVAAHNRHRHLLQRDTSLVVVLTIVVLLLSAFLANTCVQILQHYGYCYTTSSFERISDYGFMRNANEPAPGGSNGYSGTPDRFVPHGSFIVGQRSIRPGTEPGSQSGYQALRLSTELVPATLAILGTERVSPFWAVLFYFVIILFGIAQQLAIWHCVITGIMAINRKVMKVWETTITFFSCACAYVLGLPMATELGIYVVYYLDYVVGGAWWIMILYLVQVGAVFAVRGRPHTGETVVAELFPPTGRCMRHWAAPLLSFTWNVILPVALMVLGITIFKSSGFRELYVYRRSSRDYWSIWARQLGAAIQLTPILIIPGVAIIQTCRYLNSGPPDIFDRIQLLYRPPMDANGATTLPINYTNNDTSTTSIHGNGILRSSNEPPPSPATTPPFQDPPPKYTPPPSYTTATGARIAKMLRQSIRRSVRRIAGVLGETSTPRARPALQQQPSQTPQPPDYASVLIEMNQQSVMSSSSSSSSGPLPLDIMSDRTERERNRPRTIDRMTTTRISTIEPIIVERNYSTLDRARRRNKIYNSGGPGSCNLTAADVANLLRSSIRRGGAMTNRNNDSGGDSTRTINACSVENLVNAAVPINEDQNDAPLSPGDDKDTPPALVRRDTAADNDDDEIKTVDETDHTVSVI